MTSLQRRELDRLIIAHVSAQVALSWIGHAEKESHEEIESNAIDAAFDLNDFLHQMQPNPDAVAAVDAYLARVANKTTPAG